ncbi:MAG: NACHT domain-containing protein [Candidatus Eremiobacteraeota bacterium]|nr:NACHT domain-containing protein [Candidatus Eremiobacteraeota bacterium]
MSSGDEFSNLVRAANECFSGRPCPELRWWLAAFGVALFGVLAVVGHYLGAYAGAAWLLKRLGIGKPKHRAPEAAADLVRCRLFCKAQLDRFAGISNDENWDDQRFTDLEAEVLVPESQRDGAGSEVTHRPLRRVTSLIAAVEKMRRVCVLEGEPGSGKSVALRVLAKHYATSAATRPDRNAKIPLYVNLRDLPLDPSAKIDGEYLKRFVIDSVRSGYDENAAFVRDNWDDYARRSRWFFLLDSFDEIPEILRAERSEGAIARYCEAIRQLFAGTGCRGIVASRQFNGPARLPWLKLAIKELSPRRQDKLIAKSGLNSTKRDTVRRYLALRASFVRGEKSIGSNPFLLSLLCDYVDKHEKALDDDFSLVAEHLAELAKRGKDEPERLSLPPELLLDDAVKVAVAFGSAPLVMTREALVRALDAAGIPEQRAESILTALVGVKILTLDTNAETRSTERFAFAHRRYQETLLVQHIVDHPRYVVPRELMGRSVWREYAATLLQSQKLAVTEPFLRAARDLLDERAAAQKSHPISPELGVDFPLGYFQWDDEPAVPLLELLQDGLARHMADVPSWLAEAVQRFLDPRWDGGDHYDRINVVRVGGLLPQARLRERLVSAFASQTPLMQQVATEQATFLVNVPPAMALRIRGGFADAILVARSRLDILRIEALAARLPAWLEGDHAVRRSLILRALLTPFRPFTAALARLARVLPIPRELFSNAHSRVALESSVGTAIFINCMLFSLGSGITQRIPAGYIWITIREIPVELIVGLAVIAAYTAFAAVILSLFFVRQFGRQPFRSAFTSYRRMIQVPRKAVYFIIGILTLLLGLVSITIKLGTKTLLAAGLRDVAAAIIFFLCVYGIVEAAVTTVNGLRSGQRDQRDRRSKRLLRSLRKQNLREAEIVARARTAAELMLWLTSDRALLAHDVHANRSVSRVLIEARNASAAAVAGVSWLHDPGATDGAFETMDCELEGRLLIALSRNGGLQPAEVEWAGA